MDASLVLLMSISAVAGFGLAVTITISALKRSAKEVERLEAELMVMQRMQSGVDYRVTEKPAAEDRAPTAGQRPRPAKG